MMAHGVRGAGVSDGREDELARVEARLAAMRELLDVSRAPVLTVDAQGRVRSTNDQWFGEAPPQVVGEWVWALFEPSAQAVVERLATSGWIGISSVDLALQGGRRVSVSAAALRDPGPECDGWLLALRDASHRAALADAMRLRQEVGVLADLAGTVARELIDPISIVQGTLELLALDATGSTTLQRHADRALQHARRVTNTLRNLRLVGRSPFPALRRVPLVEVVAEVLEMLGPRQDRVRVELTDDELAVGGSQALYARVLFTLVREALEGAGRSTVLVQGKAGRGAVEVSVGPAGRPRGERDPSRAGLALEVTLLRSVGAYFEAWRKGNDRHFQVVLPLAPVPPKSRRAAKHTLLLVGVERFREAVEQALAADGFHFCGASSAQQALDVLRDDPSVSVVGVELIQPRAPSGMALAQSILGCRPDLAGGVLLAAQPRVERPGPGIVAVSWPVRRSEWIGAVRRRARGR